MIEVVYYVAASLDGFIATPDGGVDWLAPFQASGQDHGYSALMATIGALLMGSRTYEQALGLGEWPSTGTPTWVFSSRPLRALDPSITITSRTPGEVVGDLETQGIRRAWLMGGAALAGSFRAQGAITESIVSVVPVILGAGVPIFAPGPIEMLRLVEAKPFPDGIVQLRYLHPKKKIEKSEH